MDRDTAHQAVKELFWAIRTAGEYRGENRWSAPERSVERTLLWWTVPAMRMVVDQCHLGQVQGGWRLARTDQPCGHDDLYWTWPRDDT